MLIAVTDALKKCNVMRVRIGVFFHKVEVASTYGMSSPHFLPTSSHVEHIPQHVSNNFSFDISPFHKVAEVWGSPREQMDIYKLR